MIPKEEDTGLTGRKVIVDTSIIKNFDLRRPIYRDTAAYGHFGRVDIELP